MSITAFPVLARILIERDLLKTKVGAVSLTCAAVDDVTAWCLLAFVVATVRAAGLHQAFVTVGLALCTLAPCSSSSVLSWFALTAYMNTLDVSPRT